MRPIGQRTLSDIAEHLGAKIAGPFGTEYQAEGEVLISGLGALSSAGPTEITHLSGASYRSQLPTTRAGAVLLRPPDLPQSPVPSIVVDNPYLAFARVTQLFAPTPPPAEIAATAVIASSARIGSDVFIGPYAVIEADAEIGDGARIGSNSVVGSGSTVGSETIIEANVTLYSGVTVGARSTVHAGAVLGAAGFGFTANEQGCYEEIVQLGGLQIGADVSIGAGTTIDRGAIEDTRIGDGVKVDNLVQIGHNCQIGDHTLICGCVGLAGSTRIGKHCIIAGGVGIGGKNPITVCDGVVISAKTTVTQSIDKPGIYSGTVVASEHGTWLRNIVKLNSLADLFRRVRRLERERDNEPN